MMKLILAISLLFSARLAFAQTELAAEAAKPAYNESAIPLKFGEEKNQVIEKQSSSTKMTLAFLLLAVLLAGGTYYVRKMKNQQTGVSSLMQIKMIAQHHLGPKKSVAVIRVAGESLLIGITDNQINLIKGLAVLDEDTKMPTMEELGDDQLNTAAEEEFSFADLKSTVADKLKSVRGFQ